MFAVRLGVSLGIEPSVTDFGLWCPQEPVFEIPPWGEHAPKITRSDVEALASALRPGCVGAALRQVSVGEGRLALSWSMEESWHQPRPSPRSHGLAHDDVTR